MTRSSDPLLAMYHDVQAKVLERGLPGVDQAERDVFLAVWLRDSIVAGITDALRRNGGNGRSNGWRGQIRSQATPAGIGAGIIGRLWAIIQAVA